jgi:hypothetical protein
MRRKKRKKRTPPRIPLRPFNAGYKVLDMTHDVLFEKKWGPIIPYLTKKYGKKMTDDEVYAYHNEHDGFRREKQIDNPVFEPFLDQGTALNEFHTVKDCNESTRFWDKERQLITIAQEAIKNLANLKTMDPFNV